MNIKIGYISISHCILCFVTRTWTLEWLLAKQPSWPLSFFWDLRTRLGRESVMPMRLIGILWCLSRSFLPPWWNVCLCFTSMLIWRRIKGKESCSIRWDIKISARLPEIRIASKYPEIILDSKIRNVSPINFNGIESIISWLKKITWVIRVLRRTVVSDWRFDNLCGSHLQSQVVVLVNWKFKNPGKRLDWSVDRVVNAWCDRLWRHVRR